MHFFFHAGSGRKRNLHAQLRSPHGRACGVRESLQEIGPWIPTSVRELSRGGSGVLGFADGSKRRICAFERTDQACALHQYHAASFLAQPASRFSWVTSVFRRLLIFVSSQKIETRRTAITKSKNWRIMHHSVLHQSRRGYSSLGPVTFYGQRRFSGGTRHRPNRQLFLKPTLPSRTLNPQFPFRNSTPTFLTIPLTLL